MWRNNREIKWLVLVLVLVLVTQICIDFRKHDSFDKPPHWYKLGKAHVAEVDSVFGGIRDM